MTRYLLNSAVIPAGAAGLWRYGIVDVARARAWLLAGPFVSRIGYPENARLLTQLAGVPVAVDRREHTMRPGDVALVMRLRYRMDGPKAGDKGFGLADFEFGILTYMEGTKDR